MDIAAAVFSYNRRNCVKNCLESLWRCMPDTVPLRLFDDGSTEEGACAYLRQLEQDYPGLVELNSGTDSGRHGGLYANMQKALAWAPSRYLLFLQDDVQMVRTLERRDVRELDLFFSTSTGAAFVNPVFLKGHRRSSIVRQVRVQKKFQGYYHSIPEVLKPRPVSMYYCDVVIAHVERLRAVGWQFQETETANAELARSHFSKMLQMAHPFVMHVPEVPVFRGRKATLGSRLASRRVGSDVKAFHYMTEEEVAGMRARDIVRLPFAEDFLTTQNGAVRRPFRYNAVSTFWVTRVLHRLELVLLKVQADAVSHVRTIIGGTGREPSSGHHTIASSRQSRASVPDADTTDRPCLQSRPPDRVHRER